MATAAASPSRTILREAKEAFVTGHAGSSLHESTLICMAVICAAYIGTTATAPRWLHSAGIQCSVLVACCTLAVTTQHGAALCCVTVPGAIFLHYRHRLSSTTKATNHTPWLSLYRGSLLMLTCIAILAVDFPASPRRLAKTETFGTGLMDTGVGAFVYSSAFSAALRTRGTATTALRRAAILLALGVVRAVATEAVGYQQHVGEYGTHWNFFLTLALTTQPVAALLARNPLQSHNDSSLLAAGLLVAAMHEGMLCAGGLALVMQNPRGPGWASLNKEGLLSLPGYLALALVAAWTGRRVAQWRAQSTAVVCLGRLSALCWAALALLQRCTPLQVSRRACNLCYVLWALALNGSALSLCMWLQPCSANQNPSLLDALSRRQLYVFLVANVLTGAVNMSVNTLAVADPVARGVVGLYGMAVGTTALMLH